MAREIALREDQVTEVVRELYHGHTLRADVSEGDFEDAREAAIQLLIMAGFDEQDSDNWGAEMGDIAQSLVTVLLLRVPQLRERLLENEIRLEMTDDEPEPEKSDRVLLIETLIDSHRLMQGPVPSVTAAGEYQAALDALKDLGGPPTKEEWTAAGGV